MTDMKEWMEIDKWLTTTTKYIEPASVKKHPHRQLLQGLGDQYRDAAKRLTEKEKKIGVAERQLDDMRRGRVKAQERLQSIKTVINILMEKEPNEPKTK